MKVHVILDEDDQVVGVVYAKHAGEAADKVYKTKLIFDSWDIAVSDWGQMQ